jgi:hypothetical protein
MGYPGKVAIIAPRDEQGVSPADPCPEFKKPAPQRTVSAAILSTCTISPSISSIRESMGGGEQSEHPEFLRQVSAFAHHAER